ncbi:MAG TPA: 4-hydroxythreonine-4-phosphate dehydrogenase PdxA, partial [Ramlibacter sp.]
MSTYLPVVGITMGDATGVGPEVIVKTLARRSLTAQCRPLVIGDTKRLELANRIVKGDVKVRS